MDSPGSSASTLSRWGENGLANSGTGEAGPCPTASSSSTGARAESISPTFSSVRLMQFIQSSRQFLDGRSKSGALYIQDNFRARADLTINYGLRWEVAQPWSDARNRIQAFIPGQQSTVFTDSPTGWLFPGDKGIPPTLGPTRWNNFAPRLGLAYSPSPENGFLQKIFGAAGKSSIHAAVGQFYHNSGHNLRRFRDGRRPLWALLCKPLSHLYGNAVQGPGEWLRPRAAIPLCTSTAERQLCRISPHRPFSGLLHGKQVALCDRIQPYRPARARQFYHFDPGLRRRRRTTTCFKFRNSIRAVRRNV